MTLSEIETTVQELVARHADLTVEMLTTLLLSAGWEEKNIKDATMLFKQQGTSLPQSNKNSTITAVSSHVNAQPQSVVSLSDNNQTEVASSGTVYDPLVMNKKDGREKEIDALLSSDNDLATPLHNENNEVSVQAQVKETIESSVESLDVIVESQLSQSSSNVVAVDTMVGAVDTSVTSNQVAHIVPETHTEDTVRESLVIHTEPVRTRTSTSPVKLPDNLPLLPFESSPHVWSFSKYKDVFHPDETHPLPFEIAGHNLPEMHRSSELFHGESLVTKENITTNVISQHSVEPTLTTDKLPVTEPVIPQEFITAQAAPPPLEIFSVDAGTIDSDDEEVVFEKIPLTKGDESLVFLAGVMLLVIILILGYMYSNGRL